MTTQISAIPANSNVLTTTSLSASRIQSPASSVSASKGEDSVQLSDAAQQYLRGSNSDSTTSNSLAMVKQLVLAAAAGDVGALSLLTVA